MSFKDYLKEEAISIEVSEDGKVTGYMTSDQFKKSIGASSKTTRFMNDLLAKFNNENKHNRNKVRVSLVIKKKKIGTKADSVPYK